MNYNLQQKSYLMPSPAGAYYCITSTSSNDARRFLRRLLQEETPPLVTMELLKSWFDPDTDIGLQTLYHIQSLGWLQTMLETDRVDQGTLEDLLPSILDELSSDGKALLADSQGFCLSSTGFAHESAEEISALGADLVTLHDRHNGLLNNNLKFPSSNWGLLDAAGHSQLGFWPLYIGKESFSLSIAATPFLHRQAFLRLIWVLHTRYAAGD